MLWTHSLLIVFELLQKIIIFVVGKPLYQNSIRYGLGFGSRLYVISLIVLHEGHFTLMVCYLASTLV